MGRWIRSNKGLNVFVRFYKGQIAKRYMGDFQALAMIDYISVHKHIKSDQMSDFIRFFYEYWRKDLLRQIAETKYQREFRQLMLIGLRHCRDDLLERVAKAKEK